MSGKLISTGLLTNKGLNQLSIDSFLNKKIKALTIHIIPLSIDSKFTIITTIGWGFKAILPMIINPSLIHVAIQLNIENSNLILIIEYG